MGIHLLLYPNAIDCDVAHLCQSLKNSSKLWPTDWPTFILVRVSLAKVTTVPIHFPHSQFDQGAILFICGAGTECVNAAECVRSQGQLY